MIAGTSTFIIFILFNSEKDSINEKLQIDINGINNNGTGEPVKRAAKEKESNTFTIPLDRNGMAEYINVERSALSRELSRMKKDGLIDYYKNSFKLL